MRYLSGAIFLALGIGLAGCANADDSFLPKSTTVAVQPAVLTSHPVADAPGDTATSERGTAIVGSTTLDIPGLIGDVRRASVELPALRHAVALCGLAIFVVSVVNLALLAALWTTLSEMRRQVRVAATPAAAPAALRKPDARTADPRCSCGASISARSRTGRCRSCARAALRSTPVSGV